MIMIYQSIFKEKSKEYKGDYSVNDMQSYKKKVNQYLNEHHDDLVVYKLKNNKTLTNKDVKHLEKILWHDLGTKEDYKKEFGDKPLLKLVSKIVGLDPKATNEIFSVFLSDENLNINQMEFVKLIINYIIKNGSMDKEILNEHPFNKRGNVIKLFDGKIDIAKKIIGIIDIDFLGENMNYFKYGEREIEYLNKMDKKLGIEIDKIGMLKREVDPDVFSSLISSVISQQISTKSATTVTNKLMELCGTFNPEIIEKTELELIQKCGMSLRKANYIKGIAKSAITKEIDFESIHKLSDDQVIKELTSLKGIGEWTAEMILIHSLQRPDILSYKDLGIRRGIMKLYGLEELSKEQFEIYRNLYSPYCTVASIYLWEISSR